MKKNIYTTVLASCFQLLLYAQDGVLDLSYAQEGISRLNYSGLADIPTAMAASGNGDAVVTGYVQTNGDSEFFLLKLNEEGQEESSFSGNGNLIEMGYTSTIVTRPTGEVLVGIHSSNGFSVRQYDASGAPDLDFGESGSAVIETPIISNRLNSLVLREDGKLFIVLMDLEDQQGQFVFCQLNSDGSLDDSFGEEGFSVTEIVSLNSEKVAVTVTDQKVYAGGSSLIETSDMTIFSFDLDGSLSDDFGIGGVQSITDDAGTEVIAGISVQEDGKILGCGYGFDPDNSSSEYKAIIFRLLQDGTPDNDFGNTGIFIPEIDNQYAFASKILMQPDGKVIVGGNTGYGFDTRFLVMRLDESGQLDNSFSGDGMNETLISDFFGECVDMTLDGEGRILLTGFSQTESSYDIITARYLNNGIIGIGEIANLNTDTFSIVPNPVDDNSFSLVFDFANDIAIDVRDIAGRQVYHAEKIVLTGTTPVLKITLDDIQSGQYVVTVISKEQMTSQRLCKL